MTGVKLNGVISAGEHFFQNQDQNEFPKEYGAVNRGHGSKNKAHELLWSMWDMRMHWNRHLMSQTVEESVLK